MSDLTQKELPLSIEEQEELLKQLRAFASAEKKLERKIKRLEYDVDYVNRMFENEVQLRDSNTREKEKQYMYNQLLLDTCPSILIVFDTELKYIIGTSQLLSQQFGFLDAMELNDLPMEGIFRNNVRPEWIQSTIDKCLEVMLKRRSINYNDRIDFIDQRRMYTDITISPVIDKAGELQGVVFLMHDITELVATQKAAEAASQAKGDFLASMSHEIRTPMYAIRGMSNLLDMTALDDTQKGYVTNILKASDSLLNIINGILDFSKIDAQKLECINQNYEINDLICDVTNMINLKASEKNISFLTDIDPMLPEELIGDEMRVKQILVNILSNAVKYTKRGYIKFTISYDTMDENMANIIFTVTDTGFGMKETEMKQLFTAFSQLDVKRNRGIEGTGLGLAISKSLVQIMNGEIVVDSEYGTGSVFTIKIPQQVVNHRPIVNIIEPGEKRILIFGSGYSSDSVEKMLNRLFLKHDYLQDTFLFKKYIEKKVYTHIIYWYDFGNETIMRNINMLGNIHKMVIKDLSMVARQDSIEEIEVLFEPVLITNLARFFNNRYSDSGRSKIEDDDKKIGVFKAPKARILLVDDNEVNLMVGNELLKHYDIKVDMSDDGFNAIKLASQYNYDIILMDHMMPEMDGLETTDRIRRSNGWNKNVPIIALTANAIIGIKDMFLKNKLDDYLSKPIEIKDLNRILKQWLPPEKIMQGKTAEEEIKEIEPVSALMQKLEEVCKLEVAKTLAQVGGVEASYINILYAFKDKLKSKRGQITALYGKENWNDFRIEIHGYKSALYNIGARDLSEKARKLEMAVVKNRHSYVRENMEEFISMLDVLENQLQMVLPDKTDEKEKIKAVKEDFPALYTGLHEVEELLAELESDIALEKMETLLGISYGQELDTLLFHVKTAVQNFDYDRAAELIQQAVKPL